MLSPTTEDFDRGDKFQRYRTLPSLTDYVLVAVDTVRVEHLGRQPDGSWLRTEWRQPADRVPLRALEVEITLGQIYRRIDFPAARP